MPVKERFFTEEQLEPLDKTRIPQHIAIIPDGNRRWAEEEAKNAEAGHKEGADILIDVVKAAKELGIKALTFYTFSTENWNRPQEEVQALMWLIENYLIEQRPTMIEEGIRLETIGDLSGVSEQLQKTIAETKEMTAGGGAVDMILAINYGGRKEICRAVNSLLEEMKAGRIKEEKVTEELVKNRLDTSRWPDPDLLIRTSGERRISNFLIWQISYTELYIADLFWPQFRPGHLLQAVIDFQQRERRLGT